LGLGVASLVVPGLAVVGLVAIMGLALWLNVFGSRT
jgi:hypothetical protein